MHAPGVLGAEARGARVARPQVRDHHVRGQAQPRGGVVVHRRPEARPATPPHRPPSSSPRCATAPRFQPYVKVEVCGRYCVTGTPLSWSDAHLPNGWYLSPDRVPIPPVSATGHARLREIARRRVRIPRELLAYRRYVVDSPLWDTWFQEQPDMRRAPCFAGRGRPPLVLASARAPSPTSVRGRTGIRGLTPTPSPSPSQPLPALMTAEEEEWLVQAVMEDSEREYKRR